MLSAYELTGQRYPVLVKQAKSLADRLAGAWSLVRIDLRSTVTPELTAIS